MMRDETDDKLDAMQVIGMFMWIGWAACMTLLVAALVLIL